MGTGKDSSYNQTLSEICDELFSLVAYIREVGDIEQPEILYDRVTGLLTTMEDDGRRLKIPDTDIRDAQYAIVAIIDENVRWASRLEQEFFSRNVAGEEFFTKLEELKTAKGRNEALTVYYICLALGFEGKYFRSPERLQEYMKELQEILGLDKVPKLSPRGEGSQGAIKRRRGGVPAWTPWIVTAVGFVAVVGLVIFFRSRVGYWAAGVRSLLRGFLT